MSYNSNIESFLNVLSGKTFLDYFGTFNKVEKWIVLEPSRILRGFRETECVEVTLPFVGYTYHATVHRDDLNRYLGLDITTLDPDNKSWQTKFSDVYGYGVNNKKRSKMFKYFTKKLLMYVFRWRKYGEI